MIDRGISRRQLLGVMGATVGALPLRGFTAPGPAPVFFTHGIASGDPLADRVILWTRVLPGTGGTGVLEGRWQVALDQRFSRVVAEGVAATGPSRDNTVKVDARGLEPGTRYWYRFLFNGISSPVGRTCTLPEGTVAAFRVGVCSCSNYPQGYFNAYRDMARADIDVVMHLGDYIYEYPAGVYANPIATEQLGRQVEPANELLQLEDYRQRYGLYRTDPDLQAAHAAHPWICVWDDHELANNTWHSGAENHTAGEGDFKQRMAVARKAYHEWLPIRTPPQSDQKPIYRSFKVGDLADIIMLDTRLHGRDEQLDYRRDLIDAKMDPNTFKQARLSAPDRTILGLDQEDWLANQLAASRARGATWQFIGQQVLMGKLLIPEISESQLVGLELPSYSRDWIMGMLKIAAYQLPMNLDAWDGYAASRDRVFAALLRDASNPVVVAGDTHNAWAFNLEDRNGESVGVEVGCPSICSPGMESYFPLESARLMSALRNSSPELVDLDVKRRGWALLTMTAEQVRSEFRFVSTVLNRNFTVSQSQALVCKMGSRQFVRPS